MSAEPRTLCLDETLLLPARAASWETEAGKGGVAHAGSGGGWSGIRGGCRHAWPGLCVPSSPPRLL